MIQESTQARTRSSGSQFHLLPTVPWDRRKSKKGTEERRKIENGKFALVPKAGSDQYVNYFYSMERHFNFFFSLFSIH